MTKCIQFGSRSDKRFLFVSVLIFESADELLVPTSIRGDSLLDGLQDLRVIAVPFGLKIGEKGNAFLHDWHLLCMEECQVQEPFVKVC